MGSNTLVYLPSNWLSMRTSHTNKLSYRDLPERHCDKNLSINQKTALQSRFKTNPNFKLMLSNWLPLKSGLINSHGKNNDF